MDAQKLSQPIVVNSSDALTNISNAVSNQRNIVTSFDVLMKVLVKVGDISKIFLVLNTLNTLITLNRVLRRIRRHFALNNFYC